MASFLCIALTFYAIGMLCIFLIQFLNFKTSKWLLPMIIAIIAAILMFPLFLGFFTVAGHKFIICASETDCYPRELYFQTFFHDYGVYASVYAVAAIAIAFAIACCGTCLCYLRCRKDFENSCFPMTHKVTYDCDKP